jgi:hypothetical protein
MDRPRLRTPPNWLAATTARTRAEVDAFATLITPAYKRRQQREFKNHVKRWRAVMECRAQHMTFEKCWPAAAAMLAGTSAARGADAVEASFKLIKSAGGEGATLASYLVTVRRRRRRN